MDVEAAPVAGQEPLTDGGCLPAWDRDDLPAPVPFGWKNLVALLGPGIVLIGSSIGTGEWVMGPQAAQKYGGALLWVVPVAILCQVFLNTEAMRYTLLTGEPVFTGFLRSKPGPRFWLCWYLALDCLSWWPALAGLAAQIVLYTFFGSSGVGDPQQFRVRAVASLLLLLCALLLCFGGKIYNTLEWVLSGKVFFALGYTLLVTLLFVPWPVWQRIVGGMFNPLVVPRAPAGHPLPLSEIDWGLVAALAGFAGVGGMGNILASNFVREKGWGMGCKVGAIASAFGGHQIALSHLGTMCRPDEESRRRFRRWWAYLLADQYGIWVWGSILGMLLPCLMGAAFLKGDYIGGTTAWEAAARLAADIGSVHGAVFMKLTLLCGFVILFPGQFGTMDGIARRWCDAIWSGSRRARRADPGRVKYLYYSFVAAYTLLGLFLIWGFKGAPSVMMVISANLANIAIISCLLHTLYVNVRFLPKEFRPPRAKQLALLLAALFYGVMFALMFSQFWYKLTHGQLR